MSETENKKNQKVRITMILGGITLVVGIFALVQGKEMEIYGPAIFMGAVLIGSSYFGISNEN